MTHHMHVPGLTTEANRMSFAKEFPPTYEIKTWESWGDRGKLRILRKIAETYGRDPRMREFTIQNVVNGMARDYPRMAASILQYVQANVQYFNEPGEQVQAPWYTLQKRFGDCDDMAVLIASMAESIALPWRFCLAGKGFAGRKVKYHEGGRMPLMGEFSHIYIQLGWPPFAPETWVSAEPTIPGAPLGYDVVDHGMSTGPGGRVDLPQAFQPGAAPPLGVSLPPNGMNPRGAPMPMARLSGYAGTIVGRDGYQGWGQTTVTTAPSPTFWEKIDWSEIAAGVIQGVIISVTVAVVLRGRK